MPSITDLPSEVLTTIFKALPLEERHRTVPLVCRRWNQLCNSAPQLLHCIGLTVPRSERGIARLTAFCTWLLQHGPGRVQRLSLEALASKHSIAPALWQDLHVGLVAAVSACGAGGSLRALRLHGLCGLPCMWVQAMRGLQQLDFAAQPLEKTWSPLAFWHPAPGVLAGLEQLALSPGELTVDTHLPATLTKLHLSFEYSPKNALPAQMTALTRLHTLSLKYAGADLSALAGLTSLRRLALIHCDAWPPCLSQLNLEALALEDIGLVDDTEAAAAAAIAALQTATNLTHLVLTGAVFQSDPPAQLAALRGLRTFAWAHAYQPLALGPWAGGVERLVASASAAAGFLGALPAMAPRLAALGLYCNPYEPFQPLSTLPGLAQGLPALRHLVLALGSSPSGRLVQALLAAQRAAPNVCIDCIEVAGDLPTTAGWDALLAAVCGGPGHEAPCADAFVAEA